MPIVSLMIAAAIMLIAMGHWSMDVDTLAALIRGWFPRWQAQMRVWSIGEAVVWCAVAWACLTTARSLVKK